MFLSRYCIEFRTLDSVQQQNIIRVHNSIKEENDNKDDNDDDSTIPPIQYHDIARAGAPHWRTLTPNMIISWERQTAFLNIHPVPGLLSIFLHANLPGDL